MLVTALLTGWWVKHYFYASEFSPTQLTASEEQVLEAKLSRLDSAKPTSLRPGNVAAGQALRPESYSEEGASREIQLTERELNSIVAKNPEAAQRVALDLADDLVSVKLVVPMDEELIFLGGTTLRLNLGVELAYQDGAPIVALKGVSLGGVPLPNAWLGGLKHQNLVEEFGSEAGFWKLFADGVENIQVRDGNLLIQLKE